MSILSTSELSLQTGAGRYASVVLQEIINQAEREISGKLSEYGLSIVSCNELKAASSLLSKAGLYDRMRIDGSLVGASGAKYYNLVELAQQYRNEADKLIRSYVKENGTYQQYKYYISKSNA
jgi:hypothetical protein